MLLGRTRGEYELYVAAWPVARTKLEIFRNSGCALALARGVGVRCRNLLPFSLPLPIPATLCLTARFALRAGPIPLRCTPPPPAAGRLLARSATIPRLGARCLKPAFAPLQQTSPGAMRPMAAFPKALTICLAVPTLKRVHGSLLLPTDQVSGRR